MAIIIRLESVIIYILSPDELETFQTLAHEMILWYSPFPCYVGWTSILASIGRRHKFGCDKEVQEHGEWILFMVIHHGYMPNGCSKEAVVEIRGLVYTHPLDQIYFHGVRLRGLLKALESTKAVERDSAKYVGQFFI